MGHPCTLCTGSYICGAQEEKDGKDVQIIFYRAGQASLNAVVKGSFYDAYDWIVSGNFGFIKRGVEPIYIERIVWRRIFHGRKGQAMADTGLEKIQGAAQEDWRSEDYVYSKETFDEFVLQFLGTVKHEMSLEEYKAYIDSKIALMREHSSQSCTYYIVNISEEGYRRMKEDPLYERFVLGTIEEYKGRGYCQDGEPDYVILSFGEREEEFKGDVIRIQPKEEEQRQETYYERRKRRKKQQKIILEKKWAKERERKKANEKILLEKITMEREAQRKALVKASVKRADVTKKAIQAYEHSLLTQSELELYLR